MTLIDRYVHAVASQLPQAQRADVSQELRSSLLDQLEDRFGPQPTEEQVTEVLRELGPPETVAASYLPSSQYLIGPAWFPIFRRVVRVVLTAQLCLLVAAFAWVIFLTPAATASGATLLGFVKLAAQGAIYTFALITLIFYGLQRLDLPRTNPNREWNPKDLPDLAPHQLVNRTEALVTVAVTAVFLALLHVFSNAIGLVVLPGGRLVLNDVFQASLPWLSAAMLLSMAQQAWLLRQGHWRWYSRLTTLAIDLFGLAVVIQIARNVVAQKASLAAAGLPPVALHLIDQMAFWIPAIAAAIILADNGWFLLRRLWTKTDTPANAAAAVAA